MLSAGGVAGVRVRACLLAVTAVALLAVLALLLPPLLFRLEDGLHSHVQPATTGARPLTGARPFSFGVAQRGAVELPDLPKAEDAEWLLWRPFTINAEEVKPGVGGGAAAKKPAADRRRGGAWPPGVTEEAGQRAAARISPDVFAALPERFSDGYKAPCWRNATSGGAAPLLCLPHFYILGVFQCGVKDLYERLLMHPDVATTLNGAPHYWDEAVPFSRYLGFFAPAVTAVEAAPERVIFGDASLSTFTYTWTGSERIHLSGWTKAFRACRTDDCDGGKQPCVDETCYAKATATSPPLDGGGAGLSLPFLLRAAHGANVKLMVLLRNPVDRLHAAFWHYEHYGRQYGASEEGFTKYALEMVAAVQGCLAAGLSEALCVTAFEANGPTYEAVFYHADQVLKSMYSVFMEGWLAAFPRHDVLVLRLEDFVDVDEAAHRTVLERVVAHLGLSEPTPEVWQKMLGAPVRRNGGDSQHERGDMDPDTRAKLEAFFRPYNERLSRLLDNDPRWLWA